MRLKAKYHYLIFRFFISSYYEKSPVLIADIIRVYR